MLKKILALNPIGDKKIAIIFSALFFLNSLYYTYHAIFTPFVKQKINCRLIYLILIIIFILVSVIGKKVKNLDSEKIFNYFIFILLPSSVLMLLGYLVHPGSFKNNSRIFGNLVIVAASFILFLKFFGYRKVKDFLIEFSVKKLNFKKNIYSLLVFIVIVVNLGFGIYNLAKFAAVDEPLWTFERVPKFWNNVFDREFQKTMISDKPGITTAALSGIGMLGLNPKDYKLIKQEGEIRYTNNNVEQMNFSMRLPILLFNALMLIAFFILLSKLFNKFVGLLSVIFIGLSPILLGISRIINPDALFWVFSSLSLISYFISLKNKERKYVYLTGIFLGFSLLTKYVANILFVFYFGMIFADFVFGNQKLKWKEYFKQEIKNYLAIAYLAIFTFFIFLPASWVNLERIAEGTLLSEAFAGWWLKFLLVIAFACFEAWILKGMILSPILLFLNKNKKILTQIFLGIFIASIILVLLNTYSDMRWLNFENILASPKSTVLNPESILGVFLANFYPLIFGIHPLILALVMAVLITFFTKKFNQENETSNKSIFYILLFVFIYYLASFVSKVGATVRYQIIIYPLIFIVAAYGLDLIFARSKKWIQISSLAISCLLLLISMENIRPFYFSYASEILPQKYVLNLKDMGDGSYEAAQYLNNLPNVKDLTIWTDKRGVCYFFKGGCYDTFEMNEGMDIDYFVLSAGRESRTARHIPYKGRHNTYEIQVDKIYDNDNYDFRIDIGGRPNNYIKIFSYERLANEGK